VMASLCLLEIKLVIPSKKEIWMIQVAVDVMDLSIYSQTCLCGHLY